LVIFHDMVNQFPTALSLHLLLRHLRAGAYTKNHNLGLEVPYRFGSANHLYLPDFIVQVDDGRWAFAEFGDVWAMQEDFAAKVQEAFEAMLAKHGAKNHR